MLPSKKEKLLISSIALSLLSIAMTIIINIKIAKEYLRVDGKTKALFGIKELYQFGYQYYIALLGTISLILSLLSLGNDSMRVQKYAVILLGLFALIIVFVRVWRLFI
jgi:hypothetical protein